MTTTNQRVKESREQLSYLEQEVLSALCNVLINELGEAESDIERQAMSKLKSEDYTGAKQMCLLDPCNEYLAAISCLASAYRSPMVADSVLRDAARHAAEVAKRKAKRRIADRFSQLLN